VRLYRAHLAVRLYRAHLAVRLNRAHLAVRNQKRTGPVEVGLLADPIGDGDGGLGHLEPLAEQALQQRPGESPQGVVEVLDRSGILGGGMPVFGWDRWR